MAGGGRRWGQRAWERTVEGNPKAGAAAEAAQEPGGLGSRPTGARVASRSRSWELAGALCGAWQRTEKPHLPPAGAPPPPAQPWHPGPRPANPRRLRSETDVSFHVLEPGGPGPGQGSRGTDTSASAEWGQGTEVTVEEAAAGAACPKPGVESHRVRGHHGRALLRPLPGSVGGQATRPGHPDSVTASCQRHWPGLSLAQRREDR